MYVNGFVLRFEAEIIRCAIRLPALDAAARQPHRKAPVVVVAPVLLARVRAGCRQFHSRRPPELAAPYD